MGTKIQSFTDLIAWKEAHKLVLVIYALTKSFPKEELYSLTDQIRRAAPDFANYVPQLSFASLSKSLVS